MRTQSLIQLARDAMESHKDDARKAYRLFVDYCEGVAPCRVPGMDTIIRLAIRIQGHDGLAPLTIEGAASREYLYRWNLALRSPVFGVPHTLGL